MYLKLKQTGDTIVEVLIAIAVVSAVLSGAYTIANKSSIQIRDAQERGEAQKFASEIVERLSSNAKNSPNIYTTGTQRFCIVTSNNGTYSANDRIDISSPLPAVNAPSTDYRSECNKQNNPVGYFSVIERDTVQNTKFNVYVRWAALGGGFNEVKFVYEVSL